MCGRSRRAEQGCYHWCVLSLEESRLLRESGISESGCREQGCAGPEQHPLGSGYILGLSLLGRRTLLIMLVCPDCGSMASAFSARPALGPEGMEGDRIGSSQARESGWELRGLGRQDEPSF